MKIYHYKGKANIVGPAIKAARIQMNLSQEALAIRMQLKNIEISQKGISRIEKQERFVTDYELLAFSQILKLNIYTLLDADNSTITD